MILYIKELNCIIKLYLLAEIKNRDYNDLIYKKSDEISFSSKNLTNSLKSICNIKDNYISSIFYINDVINPYYKIFNFNNLKEYIISNSIGNYKKGNFILINNFKENENTEIIISNLTMIKLLNEEDFFKIIYRHIYQNSDYFKIIDIENDYYILVNNCKNIYKLQKNNYNLNYGQIIFIGSFILNKIDDFFNEIIVNKDSFIYISSQEIYFSKILSINHISPIKFFIKDLKIKINIIG